MERLDVIDKLECLETLDGLDVETINALRIARIVLEHTSEDDYNDLECDNYRECSECGEIMQSGFVIDNGDAYYCSEECLHKNMTDEEYNELYDNGNGDSYYTEWY